MKELRSSRKQYCTFLFEYLNIFFWKLEELSNRQTDGHADNIVYALLLGHLLLVTMNVIKNEMYKILWDFDLQTDYHALVKISDLVIFNHKKNILI